MKPKSYKIPQRIWEDRNIKPEGKYIYCYIYSKGFDKSIINLNVGELQNTVKIKNKGLKKNLENLEKNKYLIFREYATGMYTIHLLK